MPPGGAFDQESVQLANALLGNPPFAPALELAGGMIIAEAQVFCRVAIVGAEGPVLLNGFEMPSQSAFDLEIEDVLEIHAPRRGVRIYLAGLGGLAGQVSRDSVLTFGQEPRLCLPMRKLADEPGSLSTGPLRVVDGPQADVFEGQELTPGVVSMNSNRMGVRVGGLLRGDGRELASEPACVGAIQAPPDGLIILGPDGPTIGGYPKPFVVCRADLDRVAQLAPGQEVSLERVSIEVAHQLLVEKVQKHKARISGLLAAP